MPKVTRRGFMVGCSTAIAAMAGSRLSYVAFGSPEAEPNQDILVTIFLRGGFDGLNAVPVIAGTDRGTYESARSNIAIPTAGDRAALNLDGQFGLHRGAEALYELYQQNTFGIIHATGNNSATRSHFDAMEYMELGTPDSKASHTGWLTRHLNTAGNLGSEVIMPALSVGSLSPKSLAGSKEAIGMTSPSNFSFGGHWQYENWQRLAMREMYTGSSAVHGAGIQTLDAIDILETADPGTYTPENGAQYPNNSFGRNLQAVAQMIKMQLGMRVATVDLGGWDTHDSQGNDGQGYFFTRLRLLAEGMKAFYVDLNGNAANNGRRVTTVVMSEFGRSLKENGSEGTDHGHGNVMFVMGDHVKGGKVHGRWPGLGIDPNTGKSQLYDNRDLAITTDYRQVLAEILNRRMENPNIGTIFPEYTGYTPLDIVEGDGSNPQLRNDSTNGDTNSRSKSATNVDAWLYHTPTNYYASSNRSARYLDPHHHLVQHQHRQSSLIPLRYQRNRTCRELQVRNFYAN